MPGHDYIPASDRGFRTWAEQFASNISADPARFMLTAAQAASIQQAVDDFVAAFSIATNEATRNRATIAVKDDARVAATSLLRRYAMLIKNNVGIDDEDKIAIGVRPINPKRERIGAPNTFPLLKLLGNTPGRQMMRYSDSCSPDSAGKPFGTTGLQLYIAKGDEKSAPRSEAAFHRMYTRNPVAVAFDEDDDGRVATYYARWVSAKGEQGPWSLPVSMRIAA